MKRTVLAIVVAVGLVGAAAGTAGAQRSDDDGGLGRPPGASQRGGMLPSHGICDCYDFAIPVVVTQVLETSGGMNGQHVHVELRLTDGSRR
jgi:hypothetical protein